MSITAFELPWISTGQAAGDEAPLAVATRFDTARRHMPAIVNATRTVRGEITDSDGLVGYSLRARPVNGTRETLTVWTGHEALSAFRHGRAHRTAINMTQRWIKDTSSRTWNVAIVPPTWHDADERWSADPADITQQ